MHAWKVFIPPETGERELRTHDGQEWLYVLVGELRLVLADGDMILEPGEAVEFDTSVPHWFGAAGRRPVEVISILSHRGEPIRRRAGSRPHEGPLTATSDPREQPSALVVRRQVQERAVEIGHRRDADERQRATDVLPPPSSSVSTPCSPPAPRA